MLADKPLKITYPLPGHANVCVLLAGTNTEAVLLRGPPNGVDERYTFAVPLTAVTTTCVTFPAADPHGEKQRNCSLRTSTINGVLAGPLTHAKHVWESNRLVNPDNCEKVGTAIAKSLLLAMDCNSSSESASIVPILKAIIVTPVSRTRRAALAGSYPTDAFPSVNTTSTRGTPSVSGRIPAAVVNTFVRTKSRPSDVHVAPSGSVMFSIADSTALCDTPFVNARSSRVPFTRPMGSWHVPHPFVGPNVTLKPSASRIQGDPPFVHVEPQQQRQDDRSNAVSACPTRTKFHNSPGLHTGVGCAAGSGFRHVSEENVVIETRVLSSAIVV